MRFLFGGCFVVARVRVTVLKSLATAIASYIVLIPVAYAQEPPKICPGVEISSLQKSPLRPDPKPGKPAEIVVFPEQATAERTLTVIALGPILGSMDSTDVKTDLACTAKGIRLTTTITRSAQYNGAALKNVLWRPKLTLAVILRENEVTFESVWVMRLSTGAKLDHAQTPSQLDQKYPVIVTRTLSALTR